MFDAAHFSLKEQCGTAVQKMAGLLRVVQLQSYLG